MEQGCDVKSNNTTARRGDVDILRGIGIVLVMMGHIGFGSIFNIWIHGFHIPLFYIVSGFFFGSDIVSSKNFIVKKMKQLLFPYLFFSIGGILFSLVFNQGGKTYIINEVRDMLISPNIGLPVFGALWFLPVLFWMNVLVYYLCKVLKKKSAICLTCILIGLMGMTFTQVFNTHLCCGIDAAIIGIAFHGTGYGLRCYSDSSIIKKGMNINIIVLLLLLIVNFGLILFNGEVNYRTGDLNCLFLSYINAIIGTVIFWNIARRMECLNVKKSFEKPVLWIKKIGEHSIAYLCMHQFVLVILNHLCGNIEEMTLNVGTKFIIKLFYLFVMIIAVEGMRRIIEKMKLNFILGK